MVIKFHTTEGEATLTTDKGWAEPLEYVLEGEPIAKEIVTDWLEHNAAGPFGHLLELTQDLYFAAKLHPRYRWFTAMPAVTDITPAEFTYPDGWKGEKDKRCL